MAKNVNTQAIRIISLEAENRELKQQLASSLDAYEEIKGKCEDLEISTVRVAELVEQMRELQWKPIMPESMPVTGEEILGEHRIIPNPWYPMIEAVTDWHGRNLFKAEDWTEGGWKFHRPLACPITPPSPSRTPD